MSVPELTVLIDTYNYGRFIEEAIESVLSQDYPVERLQVIVVDDGSTDDTRERVKKYGSRVEYLCKQNGGQASALNAGFARARGEIVVLLDADDYFVPGKLRRVAEEFRGHPEAGMLYNALREFHAETGKVLEPEFVCVSGFLPNDVRKLVAFNAYPTSCLAFRRSVVERVLPIPEYVRLQADGYIELLAVLLSPVIAVPDVLSVYRVHGGNLYHVGGGVASRKERLRRVDSHRNLIRALKHWMREHGHEIKGIPAGVLLRSQVLILEEQGNLIEAPGRLRSFWFLLRRNYNYRVLQTWRFTLFNYLVALASLAVGYSGSRTLLAWGTLGRGKRTE